MNIINSQNANLQQLERKASIFASLEPKTPWLACRLPDDDHDDDNDDEDNDVIMTMLTMERTSRNGADQ